jgi:CRP/FNR family transcriptional regulator, cyclic AMP receptor protein
VAKAKEKPKAKLEDVLALVPMFRGLSRKQLKHVASVCEVGDFMSGHAIVKEGDPGDAFYVVLTGQAAVSAKGRFLARLLPGDHFGEIAVVDGGPRTATVTTELPSTLLILTRANFRSAMLDDPELAFHMLAEMARMFRRVSNAGMN